MFYSLRFSLCRMHCYFACRHLCAPALLRSPASRTPAVRTVLCLRIVGFTLRLARYLAPAVAPPPRRALPPACLPHTVCARSPWVRRSRAGSAVSLLRYSLPAVSACLSAYLLPAFYVYNISHLPAPRLRFACLTARLCAAALLIVLPLDLHLRFWISAHASLYRRFRCCRVSARFKRCSSSWKHPTASASLSPFFSLPICSERIRALWHLSGVDDDKYVANNDVARARRIHIKHRRTRKTSSRKTSSIDIRLK